MSQHPVKNMTQYNVIMPLKHYFEENVFIIIFKE